jgi:prepilin peptidase CpaA
MSAAAGALPVTEICVMNPVYVAALATAVVACATDLRTRRIPNVLTFGSATAALLFHVANGGAAELASGLAGWVVGVALFFVPFALKGLGGGDVKLLGALGAWLGPAGIVWAALYAGIAGGVMAVLVSLARGYLRTALQNVWLLLCHWRVAGLRALPELTLEISTAPKLAYALPIFAGTAVSIWLQ